jgi:hypothetical protein
MERRGILVPNSAGLVTTLAAGTLGALVHTLSTGSSAIVRKIMWSNNTGAAITIILGTQTNATPGVFTALLPTITCVNGQHDFLTEDELPDVIFRPDRTAAPAGFTGNIYVWASAINVFVRATVEEFRA